MTRGEGPRLFLADAPPAERTIRACESLDNGAVYLSYQPKS